MTGQIETKWGPSYAEDTPRWKDDAEDLAEAFSGTHLEDEGDLDEEDQDSRLYRPVPPVASPIFPPAPYIVCADSHAAGYSYTKPDYAPQYPTGDGGSSSKKSSKKDSKKKSKKGKERVDYDEDEEEQQEDDIPYGLNPDSDNPHLPQGIACSSPFVYLYLTVRS